MKKFILILLAVFLLGSLPKEQWDKATPNQQQDFMLLLADAFAPAISCVQGTITAMDDEKTVHFVFDCTVYTKKEI
jgi:hypothetical protein